MIFSESESKKREMDFSINQQLEKLRYTDNQEEQELEQPQYKHLKEYDNRNLVRTIIENVKHS